MPQFFQSRPITKSQLISVNSSLSKPSISLRQVFKNFGGSAREQDMGTNQTCICQSEGNHGSTIYPSDQKRHNYTSQFGSQVSLICSCIWLNVTISVCLEQFPYVESSPGPWISTLISRHEDWCPWQKSNFSKKWQNRDEPSHVQM